MWVKHAHFIRQSITHEMKTEHVTLKLIERPGTTEFEAILYAEPLDKVQICRIGAKNAANAKELALKFARKCLDTQAKKIETVRLELEEGDEDMDTN